MIIGIDPGAKGGVAYIDNKGKLITACFMPSDMDLYKLLSGDISDDDIVYIEKSAPRPSDGNQSIFSNGKHYGVYLTILNIIGLSKRIEIHEVPPITWKSKLGCSKDKDVSMRLCEHVFPYSKKYIYGSKGGKLDGVAEAILIAHYGFLSGSRRIDRSFDRDNSISNKRGSVVHGNNSSNNICDLSVCGIKERSKKTQREKDREKYLF